jgi:hypothetical protein
MDPGLLAVARFALIFIAVMFLLAPLSVWLTTRAPARHRFAPADWRETVQAGEPPLAQLHERLLALGYVPCAASRLSATMAGVVFVVYRHPGDATLATAAVARNPFDTVYSVQFQAMLSGGICLSLGNSKIAGVFPRWERERSFALPGWKDIGDLHSRFLRLRDRAGLAMAPPRPGEELACMEEFVHDQHRWLIERGFYRPTGDGSRVRMSITAAYRSSWRQLWPISQWLLAARRREAWRLSAA